MRLSRALSDLVRYTKSVRVHDIETQGKHTSDLLKGVRSEILTCFFFFFLLSLSFYKQLAGFVPERDGDEPDSAAQAGRAGPLQPAAAPQGLPVQLQSGLQQLQPPAILEHRVSHG